MLGLPHRTSLIHTVASNCQAIKFSATNIMHRKAIRKEEPKGARLTLNELAAYDDVSTDVMVDQVRSS